MSFDPHARLRTGLLASCLALGAAGLLASPAGAVPVAATGTTQVYVSAFGTLTDGLGLTVTPLGPTELFQPADLPSPSLFFPVTAFDAAEAQVFHDGIGLELAAGATVVSLENFIVDADDGVVLADVTFSGGFVADAPVFDVVDCATGGGCVGLDGTTTVDGLGLLLSDTAEGVLEGDFGVALDDDLPIGVANSTFSVPEPSAASLLLAGAGWWALRRRQG